MNAAIISLGSTSSEWTIEAMKKYFDEVDDINIKNIEVSVTKEGIEVLNNGIPIKDYDCVFVKGSFRYALLLRTITTYLEGKGTTYFPIQAEAFNIVHDKMLTFLELQKKNISVPKTYLASTPSSGKKILEKMKYPVIIKLPQGTQGKGVMFADSYASASSTLDALATLRQPFIIQEYVDANGEDTRVIVAGDKVIGAYKRKAAENEVRSNIHSGGKGIFYEPSDKVKELSIRTAKALKSEICAIDILEGFQGPVVIEANLSPGLQGITSITGLDVAGEIAKFLFEKTKALKEKLGHEMKTTASKVLDIELGTKGSQEILANLDMRSSKILLPEVVTKISQFKENDEVAINAEIGKVTISKI
ncbi:RimK family alpha-L-glutamate ligase [Candidatus Woesearchaeota archaeon]|nr:RimK family alpha-L-glutamate ligase [Candidatus Woesearchaeota archaeon]